MRKQLILLFLVLIVFISGCYFLKPKYTKIYTKEDYFLYKVPFRDTAGLLKFNGVYQSGNDSMIGFTRFYPDGKVVTGGCYSKCNELTLNDLYDNEKKISLNGYYLVRRDTVFIEWTDNVPISVGLWFKIYTIHSDTLTGLYMFDRVFLKKRNLSDYPKPGEKGVDLHPSRKVFLPLILRDCIKKDW